MISKRVIINLMVVCVVAMLAEETEGFLSFLSPSDYQKKLENDRIRVGKNLPMNLQKRSEENNLSEVSSTEEMKVIKLCVPFEIGIKMNTKQYQKYGEHLGELLQNILSENTNGQ
ncbi:motilin-like [Stegostoma tigrinum]|uniref:motilin-like n=1 Tax=Stegostoma tigrinum TaxID=3053191 RepID=UPI00202B6C61|nr:motilin-like [Stegostoma tigrinum]